MRSIIGFVIAVILLIVLFSWLRIEGKKLLTPNIRNIFSNSSSSTGTQSGVPDSISAGGGNDPSVSSYAGKVVISAINLGNYASVSIQNNGVAQIPLSTWTLKSGNTTITIPRGNPRATVGGSPTPVLLGGGQTAAIFEGVRNEQAISLHPNVDWYLWTGTQFLSDKGNLVLYDERGREVATFSY